MHFEIPADNVARAKKFYEQAFGWKITDPWKMDYFMVETKQKGEEGINGGLMKRKMLGQPFMNYIVVENIEVSIMSAKTAGAKIVLPKQTMDQDFGWLAAFKDTEGNIMGLHQPSAKMLAMADEQKAAKRGFARIVNEKGCLPEKS